MPHQKTKMLMSPSPTRRTKLRHTIATQVAVVAAIYAVLVAGILLGHYLARRSNVPTEASEIVALKARLAQQPKSPALKTAIRDLDLELRKAYFSDRDFTSFGLGLLMAAGVVFLVSAKIALAAKKKIPYPEVVEIPIDREAKEFAVARVAVLAIALMLIVGTVAAVVVAERHTAGLREAVEVAMVQLQEDQPTQSEPLASAPAPAAEGKTPAPTPKQPSTLESPPSPEQWVAAWPRFRGPDGSGHSAYEEGLPRMWNAETEENVLWKTKVPLPGHGSPVVWEKCLFLTGADKERRMVFCFDTETGQMLWQKEVPGTPQSTAKVPKVLEDTGFAAPSPTTDGRRVYAIFANGDVAALDFDGQVVWSRSLGIPDSIYGFATSPVLCDGRLLIQFDQGASDDDKSRIMALDVRNGETLWETKREVPNSWATPLVVRAEDGSAQIITTADPWVIAYDVADGKELWRIECLIGDQGVSPVVADGLLQVGNEYCQWQAIRLDLKHRGELPEEAIVWTGEDGLPDMVSPVVVDGLLLLTTTGGTVTCYDATSGEMLWEEEFDAEFTSSPGVVGKYVYYIAKEGNGWVLEPTRDGCKRLSETNLGEPCVTSPAFQAGRIYLRGQKHVFGLGKK